MYKRQLQDAGGAGAEGVGARVVLLRPVALGRSVGLVLLQGLTAAVDALQGLAHAHAVGHVHDLGQARLLLQDHEARVRGGREGLGERHLVRVGAGVVDRPGRAAVGVGLRGVGGRYVDGLVDAGDAVLQRRGGGEDLVHRAGAEREHLGGHGAGDLAELGAVAVVAVGDEGAHLVLVLAGLDDRHDVRDAVLRLGHLLLGRLLRRLGGLRVHRGLDGEAAALQLLGRDAGGAQVVEQVVAEEAVDRAVTGADAALGQDLQVLDHAQRRGLVLVGLLLGLGLVGAERAVLAHLVDDDVATLQRLVRRGTGVQRRRAVRDRGEQRGLRDRQLVRGRVEVRLGRRAHTVGLVAQRHDVQVAGEDVVLGHLLFELQRDAGLAQLAADSRLGGLLPGLLLVVGTEHERHVVLDELLRESRGTLRGATVHTGLGGGTGDALPVDAAVLVEPLVLDREDRGLHGVRDLAGGQRDAVLVVQVGDRLAVHVLDGRDERQLRLREITGRLVDLVGGAVGREPETSDEREHHRGEEHARRQAQPQQLDQA